MARQQARVTLMRGKRQIGPDHTAFLDPRDLKALDAHLTAHVIADGWPADRAGEFVLLVEVDGKTTRYHR